MDGDKGVTIRPARDSDSAGLIRLIGDCYADYDNCVLDVETEETILLAPASGFQAAGGHLWSAEHPELGIIGCCGWMPCAEPEAIELKKLYVDARARRRGLAGQLSAHVEDAARRLGKQRIILWTDTRFIEAHAFYRARGYVADGRTRRLHDRSDTTEYFFSRLLG